VASRQHGGRKHSVRELNLLDVSSGHADHCSTGKHRYATKDHAKRVAKRLRGRGRMGAYRCQVCGWWHIGHLRPDVVAGDTSRAEAYGTADE
jgi:hypothetical protein